MNPLLLLRDLVSIVVQLYGILIIASAIISWVRPNPYHPAVRWVRRLTEPGYDAVRRALPMLRAGMVDFTPAALYLLVQLAGRLIILAIDSAIRRA